MCGIAGIVSLSGQAVPDLAQRLDQMSAAIAHRGPDGSGVFLAEGNVCGLAHRRLAIMDTTEEGAQPRTHMGRTVVFNGEIYNHHELFDGRPEADAVMDDDYQRMRGMFAFAKWCSRSKTLTLVRDRYGIKPLYWTRVDDLLYFASETKALLPFCSTDEDVVGLAQYEAFQWCVGDRTMYADIKALQPGYVLKVNPMKPGQLSSIDNMKWWRWYNPETAIDYDHTERWFVTQLRERMQESVRLHMRSAVPVGAFVSGGLDSGAVGAMASDTASLEGAPGVLSYLTGKFFNDGHNESAYAQAIAEWHGRSLEHHPIHPEDFIEHMPAVIRALDYPVAGPGAFAQYVLAGRAAQIGKVWLGGSGGDEIFGGYARYLVAYFEQCLRGAMDRSGDASYVATYESIFGGLATLKGYEPMMRHFFARGMFEPPEDRYLRLISRGHVSDVAREAFRAAWPTEGPYLDRMMRFDFETLLPALLHVEDRVSMAHGIETRVPLLDHELVEFVRTIPADLKFRNGQLKYVLRQACASLLPSVVLNRTDKMGFPVPIDLWMDEHEGVREFVLDRLGGDYTGRGRRLWADLSMALWRELNQRDREGPNDV